MTTILNVWRGALSWFSSISWWMTIYPIPWQMSNIQESHRSFHLLYDLLYNDILLWVTSDWSFVEGLTSFLTMPAWIPLSSPIHFKWYTTQLLARRDLTTTINVNGSVKGQTWNGKVLNSERKLGFFWDWCTYQPMMPKSSELFWKPWKHRVVDELGSLPGSNWSCYKTTRC